ncbi:MAG: helix-turn-helix transcriptional regulator [Mesoflavibacter sp.]|nr:helix-turn-helix transcriptional regulator [Mesoflavibacter sp.]
MPSRRKNQLPDIDKKIGSKLANIRKENGLTQKQLSEETGISQQQLSHYEKGNLHISAEMIVRLAKKLNITADELLNMKEHQDSTSTLSLRFTRRIRELDALPEIKKKAILQVLDDLIRANS